MSDIVTERSNGILRVQFNRPEKKNAMTNAMYVQLADIFNKAGEDEATRVVLWHGAGESFCAGNDIGDFLKPREPGKTPQAHLDGRVHRLRKADRRGRARRGDRRRDHDAHALRFRLRRRERQVQAAVYRSGARAGVRIELCAARAHRAPARGRDVPAGDAF